MKQRCLFVWLLLAVASIHSFGQTTPTLVYDFGKGVFVKGDYVEDGKVKPVPFGSFAIIKVINVNTFRYQVEIKGKSIDYVTQVPSELQAIFRLPGATQPDNTAKTNAALTDAGKAEALSQQATDLTREKIKVNKDIIANSERYINANTDLNSIKSFGKKPLNDKQSSDTARINKEIKEYKNKLNAELNTSVSPDNISYYMDIMQAENKELSKIEQVYTDLNKACAAYFESVRRVSAIKLRRGELIDLSKQNWPDYKELSNRLPAPFSEDMMRADYQKFSDAYLEVIAVATRAGTVQGVDNEIIKTIVKKLEDSFKNLNDDGFLNLVRDVILLQTVLGNPGSFSVVSPPIQIQGDFVAFDIRAVPSRASDLQNFLSDKSFGVEMPVKRGLKVDFSVGPVLAFGKGSHDERYYLEETASPDSVFLRQRDNNNAISPGIAAQMHIYSRTGRNYALAAMFGVGAGFQSTSDANFCLFGGASWVMGRQQKVMLSLGIAYLQVDRLRNKEYEAGKKYAAAKITLPGVTEKVFKPSGFISISYNITNRVEVK